MSYKPVEVKQVALFESEPWKEEWQGMPEFVQHKMECFKEVVVRFEKEEDYLDFQRLINQKMTMKTKSIWHPFKSHWGLPKGVYKDES
jgi:hypothetical protein